MATGITLLGYFLGQVDVIEQNLEIAILAVVFISVIPIAVELWKARKGEPTPALDAAHDVVEAADKMAGPWPFEDSKD